MFAPRESVTGAGPDRTCDCLAAPLVEILEELRAVIRTLNDVEFTRPMGPLFLDATIGGHVRHCLDHVRAIVDGHDTGAIDYDHRERGTAIERSAAAAEAECGSLASSLRGLSRVESNRGARVSVMPRRDGEPVELGSTLARELAFVLSHTVHHNAMIRGMVTSLGRPLPKAFGYAPSTLAHQDGSACAR